MKRQRSISTVGAKRINVSADQAIPQTAAEAGIHPREVVELAGRISRFVKCKRSRWIDFANQELRMSKTQHIDREISKAGIKK